MAARKRSSSSTPLDSRQRALLEEHTRLLKKIDTLQRKIEEVPKIREEAQKRQRDEIARTVRGPRRDAPVLLDKRHDVTMASPARRQRPLKAQRRQSQITFLGLSIGLFLLLAWLYSVWRW